MGKIKKCSLAVIGATGQLGSDICCHAEREGYRVFAVEHEMMDIRKLNDVRTVLHELQPDYIINTAAFVDVENCDSDIHCVFGTNSLGAVHVAIVSHELNSHHTLISTDYVFNGKKPSPLDEPLNTFNSYSEQDDAQPLNTYGISKYLAEQLVSSLCKTYLIIRVSSLFGSKGPRGKSGTFIEKILNKIEKNEPVTVVSDQWVTPTYSQDAAYAILQLLDHDYQGIVHVVNEGYCSWYELALEAATLVGYESQLITATTLDAFQSKVMRPKNTCLNTTFLRSIIGHPLPHWKDALKRYLIEKGYCHQS